MKRTNQLQPLSRQHHLGLNISRHAKECNHEPNEISEHWHKLTSYINNMSHHFEIEDNLIANALQPHRNSIPDVAKALDTLDEQHIALHSLITETETETAHPSNVTATQVKALGNLLYDHIRFEERELFPLVETYLTEEELDSIYAASADSIKRPDENR